MRIRSKVLHMLVLWLAAFACAHAGTAVRVVETWPAGADVTLARNQNFYLRLAYDSDVPAGVWVAPYCRGRRADAGTSPSARYRGRGEMLGWFFLMTPDACVDEIRISAGNGGPDTTPVVATWRGSVRSGVGVATTPAPGWVGTLRAQAEAVRRVERDARARQPAKPGEMALFGGFMAAVLAAGVIGVFAPAWAAWRWRGAWRIAALLPAAWMAFVLLRIAIGTALDPTSHNLWPFELLQAGVLCAVAIGAIALVRRLAGASATGRRAC